MDRTCHRCKETRPATAENFVKDASRALGISYECRACHRARKLGRDHRTDRYASLTPEQKVTLRARQVRYNRTTKGRAVFLRKAYQRVDACDLTTAEVVAIIEQPCVYCGTLTAPRGLDRIDNALPHVKGNVLPACATCNCARGDRLTVAEMKRVGLLIREIMEARHAG